MVVHVCSLSTQEATIGGLLWVQVQLGLYGEYQYQASLSLLLLNKILSQLAKQTNKSKKPVNGGDSSRYRCETHRDGSRKNGREEKPLVHSGLAKVRSSVSQPHHTVAF